MHFGQNSTFPLIYGVLAYIKGWFQSLEISFLLIKLN